jgi:hypothetical protein
MRASQKCNQFSSISSTFSLPPGFCIRFLSSESRLESYATPDRHSARLSWNKGPNWGLRSNFYYCQTDAGLLMWGALSDEDGSVVYNCCWSSQAQSFLCESESIHSPVGFHSALLSSCRVGNHCNYRGNPICL